MSFKGFRRLIFFCLLALLCLKTGAQSKFALPSNPQDTVDLVNYAKSILKTIKSADYAGFSKFIHPTLGVRFSPYAYTNIKSDLRFSRAKFLTALNSNKKLNWGIEDPTGDRIQMTIKAYIKKYFYDVDFLAFNIISVNKFIGKSNTVNNLAEIYKDYGFVEFHCKGINKKYEGMDWRSVRLVISKYKGKFYLVGVVHDQWTI